MASLINTDIIDPGNDAFWVDNQLTRGLISGKELLVITSEYHNGGPEEAQLIKMLGACNLTADQYNILMLAPGVKAAWHLIREQLQPKIVLLTGILPAQLGISALFILNAPNNFDGRIWLATLSLGELVQREDVRKDLWGNSLKLLFIDKKIKY